LIIGRGFNGKLAAVSIGRAEDETEQDALQLDFARDHYAAVYFHTDDQGDQQWPVTAEVILPEDLPNGVYAIELSAGGAVDHLPIVVRRNTGQKAPLLVLLPSMTYLAYTADGCGRTVSSHVSQL